MCSFCPGSHWRRYNSLSHFTLEKLCQQYLCRIKVSLELPNQFALICYKYLRPLGTFALLSNTIWWKASNRQSHSHDVSTGFVSFGVDHSPFRFSKCLILKACAKLSWCRLLLKTQMMPPPRGARYQGKIRKHLILKATFQNALKLTRILFSWFIIIINLLLVLLFRMPQRCRRSGGIEDRNATLRKPKA